MNAKGRWQEECAGRNCGCGGIIGRDGKNRGFREFTCIESVASGQIFGPISKEFRGPHTLVEKQRGLKEKEIKRTPVTILLSISG